MFRVNNENLMPEKTILNFLIEKRETVKVEIQWEILILPHRLIYDHDNH